MKKILSLLVISLFTCIYVQAQDRVALVIGNGNYKNSPLDNPVQDAMEIEQKLSELNFDTILRTDCNIDDMDTAFGEFYKKSKNAEVALFYFSGHGVQSGGVNYLLPIDHTISNDEQIRRQAIDVNEIMSRTQDTGCETTILILDACRNNPFGKSRGTSGRGLVTVNTTSVSDYLIAFACENGKTADDGTGNKHSPFTQSLLDHLSDKKSFVDIMQAVRREVQDKTNNKQSPYCEPHISNPVYLNGIDENEVKVLPEPRIIERKRSIIWPFILGMIVATLFAVGIIFFAFTEKGKKMVAHIRKKAVIIINRIQKKIASLKEKKQDEDSPVSFNIDPQMKAEDIVDHLREENANRSEDTMRNPFSGTQNGNLIPFVEVDELLVAKFPVTVGHYNELVPEQQHIAWETEPVTNVSWYDALKYLNRLSEKEGLEPVYDLTDLNEIKTDPEKNGWRLPTEKEWKRIAHVSWGKGNSLDEIAWTSSNSNGTLHAVGQNKACSSGLYDVFGLVWEWCSDVVRGKYRVTMGGAWDADEKYCLSNVSQKFVPEYEGDNVGFRGVRNK
ncbi:MAG: caspase family protein [Treponema sp.]|nr:caspase family protein [Treponema sp.]